jgi:FixJ family two-component response regulator
MFVTGSGSGRMAAEARRLGASGVFTTPVDVDVLKGAVRNAMA